MLVFREVGQTQQRLLQNAAGLAGPHHADGQVGEALGMVRQRVRQGRARLDLVPDGGQYFLESRILLLLQKSAKRPDQGKLGLGERGHLPQEVHHFLVFDFAALLGQLDPDRRLRGGVAFVELGDENMLGLQLRFRFGKAIADKRAVGRLALGVQTFIGKRGHGAFGMACLPARGAEGKSSLRPREKA